MSLAFGYRFPREIRSTITPGLGVALLAAILFVCLRFASTPLNYVQTPQEEVEIAWRKLGVLQPRIIKYWDEENHEIYIDTALWQRLPGPVREDLGRAMAVAMSASRVDVRDWQSGKTIGRFRADGPSGGSGEER